MASRKKSRIQSRTDPDPDPQPWKVKPASAQAHKQWQEAMQREPDMMSAERARLTERPTFRGDNPRWTHQLKHDLATRRVGSDKLPQWQHELTSGGRIWYCIDKEERVVWVTNVALSHPKETE